MEIEALSCFPVPRLSRRNPKQFLRLFGVALREGRDHLEMKMAPRGTIKPYWGPVGGWGSARSVDQILFRERRPFIGPLTLLHQNKPAGFQCVSCSYAKPAIRILSGS